MTAHLTRPPTVHIVEDDQSVRDALEAVLSGEGLAVLCWADGMSFIRDAHVEQHDIVVLDIHLPGLTGTAVAEELRHRVRGVRIIVLSGLKAATFHRAVGIISPYASFRKPIDPCIFVASVNAAARDAGPDTMMHH